MRSSTFWATIIVINGLVAIVEYNVFCPAVAIVSYLLYSIFKAEEEVKASRED